MNENMREDGEKEREKEREEREFLHGVQEELQLQTPTLRRPQNSQGKSQTSVDQTSADVDDSKAWKPPR